MEDVVLQEKCNSVFGFIASIIPSKRMPIGIGLVMSLAFSSTSALAQFSEVSSEQRCNEVAAKLRPSFWDAMREAADATVCRKPWVERSAEEFAACATTDLSLKFSQAVKDKWNAFFDARNDEWATWGPRAVGANGENGTIEAGFKRTFFGAGLTGTTSVVSIRKRSGRAEGKISICEILENGDVARVHRREFANGNDNFGETISVSIPNTQVKTIGIVVDTAAGFNSFSYNVNLTTDFGPLGPEVEGLADLHIHQLADRGFAGRVFWGEHRGRKNRVLQAEQTSPGSENLVELADSISHPPNPLPGQPVLPDFRIDANIIMTASRLGVGENLSDFLSGDGSRISSWSKRDEDGFFQVGGGGAPDYENWPHHADRSHNQAHISWLRRAHNDGLNLIVVSLVNSPFLCNTLKLVDAYGNIPNYRQNGSIRDWASSGWNCDTKANIDRQIAAAQALERDFSWYKIALSPNHARQIIADGDLAVILSIESDGVLNDESGAGDFEDELQRLRRQGVSTLQIVHERDSRFCGASPHRNELEIIQRLRYGINPRFLAAIVTGTNPEPAFSRDANGRNTVGLKQNGQELVDLMASEGMPIDIAHASVQCRNDIFDRIENNPDNSYGLYDSHTKFEKLLNPNDPDNSDELPFIPEGFEREEEFLITEDILERYRTHDVLVGLRTAAVDVYAAPPRQNGRRGVANTCPGSSRSYAQLVDYATQSGLDIAFGSDINGIIAQLGPRMGAGRCYAANTPTGIRMRMRPEPTSPIRGSRGSIVTRNGQLSRPGSSPRVQRPSGISSVREIDGQNYYEDGLVSVAWLPELYEDLRTLNTPGVRKLGKSAEAYLQTWERATGQR
jgi:Membrane dipeptidase (Peptidase family M19)